MAVAALAQAVRKYAGTAAVCAVALAVGLAGPAYALSQPAESPRQQPTGTPPADEADLGPSSSRTAAQAAAPECAVVAQGQAREIRSGLCVRSTIDPADPKNDENDPYEDWRLPLAAGQSVQIDMDYLLPMPGSAPSTPQEQAGRALDRFAFDTYLELRREGAADTLAVNDDRGDGSLDSTLRFTAASDGVYFVRARALGGGGGEYSLRVAEAAREPLPEPLSIGSHDIRPVAGTGPIRRRFVLDGRARQRVHVSVREPEIMLNYRLELFGPDGDLVADAGELGGARSLFAILPRTGRYELRLQSARRNLTLDVERGNHVGIGEPRRVQAGETVAGEIGLASPAAPLGDGTDALMLQELYELRVRAGETVTVMLESTDFDPVLDAGAWSALGFAAARSDDDGGPGFASRLVLRPERGGSIVLRVRALGDGTGPFRLRIVRGEAPAPAD